MNEDVKALEEALQAGPTGGPWRWQFNAEHKNVSLNGGDYRQYDLTVMDFVRWGTHGAVPRVRDLSERGMNLLHRLCDRPDWITNFPGRDHHSSWCAQVVHPDMRWMQEAHPDRIRRLLDYIADLERASKEGWRYAKECDEARREAEGRAAELRAEVERLRADARRYEYILNCEVLAASKYIKVDPDAFKAARRAAHDAQIIAYLVDGND